MADNHQLLADGNVDDDIFVYTGGRAPRDVRRAKIDEAIDTIPRDAFRGCEQLIEVEGHDKLKKIEHFAFLRCRRLRRITKMGGVIEIERDAFNYCEALSVLELDKLEIIRVGAFAFCRSLTSIILPSVRTIKAWAFQNCYALTEAVFGEDLEGIERDAFTGCSSLRSIAIPLKENLTVEDYAFLACENILHVDVIGAGMHETISSLHLESWRDEMKEEIDSINQTIQGTPGVEKGAAIQQWIRSVLDKMEHYKAEHQILLKEAMTLLELALWKAKLLNEEGMQCEVEEAKKAKKAKTDKESARTEYRVTCGVNIVIKNVLPFLALKK
jgi:hypothetical protein